MRLGVALNLSIFYHSIAGRVPRAYATAKEAFDLAVAELDTVPEGSKARRDCMDVMRRLQENVGAWREEVEYLASAGGDEEAIALQLERKHDYPTWDP